MDESRKVNKALYSAVRTVKSRDKKNFRRHKDLP